MRVGEVLAGFLLRKKFFSAVKISEKTLTILTEGLRDGLRARFLVILCV